MLIIFVLIVILIAAAAVVYFGFIAPNKKDVNGCLVNQGYSWCKYSQKCGGQEDFCEPTADWILEEAKKITGLNMNIIPNEFIKWKKGDKEIAFSAKGVYYLDLPDSQKLADYFNGWDKLLRENGFEEIADVSVSLHDGENKIGYRKEKNICVINKVDNPNNTASLSLFCGNADNELCAFGEDCNRQCQQDSDCGLFTDGCAKRIVCRNKDSVFYNDCANPTSNVDELDVRIRDCICLENQCVPKSEKLRSIN